MCVSEWRPNQPCLQYLQADAHQPDCGLCQTKGEQIKKKVHWKAKLKKTVLTHLQDHHRGVFEWSPDSWPIYSSVAWMCFKILVWFQVWMCAFVNESRLFQPCMAGCDSIMVTCSGDVFTLWINTDYPTLKSGPLGQWFLTPQGGARDCRGCARLELENLRSSNVCMNPLKTYSVCILIFAQI